MLTSLGKSKQETNGKKVPVIGSKVKVSITPRAAVIHVGAQILLSRAVGVVIHGLVAVPMAWLLEMGSNTG